MLRPNAMSAAPTLSVVIVCLNPGPRLPVALASVWAQLHVAPEIIVIDGGSTDGSLAWLESQRDRLAAIVSEPDAGVYDAMNKGVALATGGWVYFLGADEGWPLRRSATMRSAVARVHQVIDDVIETRVRLPNG